MLGRAVGNRNAQADRSSGVVDKYYNPVRGYHFIHTAVDAHSRLAYSELLADESKDTAASFWLRANTWFTERGIVVRKVLTDNGNCYRSHVFRDALGDIEHCGDLVDVDVKKLGKIPAPCWSHARSFLRRPQARRG